MSIQEFAEGVSFLAGRSPLFGDAPLDVALIANPRAGGFTRPRIHARHLEEIKALRDRASGLTPRSAPTNFRLYATAYPGHATEVTAAMAEEARAAPKTERLIVTAGGDGTTLEALSALMALSEAERRGSRCCDFPWVRERRSGRPGASRRSIPSDGAFPVRPTARDPRGSRLRGEARGQGTLVVLQYCVHGGGRVHHPHDERLKTTCPGIPISSGGYSHDIL
jgi:hypothetical protein